MPGPPKTPTSILQARGSWRGNRPAEPMPTLHLDHCPLTLSSAGKKVWQQVVAGLQNMGIAKHPDGNALARYCCLFVAWKKLYKDVDKNGTVQTILMKNGDEMIKPRPQYKQLLETNAQLLRLECQFGLTPASRAGITIPEKPDKDDTEIRFFGGN